jgi:HPt (histidine-containing phosphotransfer) domain-containing protein
MLRCQPFASSRHCAAMAVPLIHVLECVDSGLLSAPADAPGVEDNAVKADLSTPRGRREAVGSGMLRGPRTPGGPQFDFRKLGTDDHPSRRLRQRQMLAMLNMHLRVHAAAESDDSKSAAGVNTGASPLGGELSALDSAALARLAELDPQGTNRLIERVLQAFQASVTRLRPQLEAARASGDRAPIRLVAHTLKSSSASIGALQLSQLCARIEAAVRLGNCDHLEADLDSMSAALDETIAAIEHFLKGRT